MWGDRRKNQGFGELSTFHIGTTAFPRGWDQLDWKDRLGLDFGVCHACDSTCWPLLPATQAGGEALHLAPVLFSRGLRQYDAGERGGPVSCGFSRTLSSLPGIPPGDGHLRFLRGKGCFLESKGWGVLLPVMSVCSDPKLGDMHSSAWTLFCHFPVHLLSQSDFHCSLSPTGPR